MTESSVITGTQIWREVIERPLHDGFDRLDAIVGYASPPMVYEVLDCAGQRPLHLWLTVGMFVVEGVMRTSHEAFVRLVRRDLPGRVYVRYVITGQPVHSKSFLWSSGDRRRAFVGSSNFSRNGLRGGYGELMTAAEPSLVQRYHESVLPRTLSCDDSAVPSSLLHMRSRQVPRIEEHLPRTVDQEIDSLDQWEVDLRSSRSATGVAYGLNWGRRDGRNPDEAYLPVPAALARSGFLPPHGQRFTLTSIDPRAPETLSVVLAQQSSKAIETPEDNSLMGRFIRRRLGLSSGQEITESNLIAASATRYRLYRFDPETFLIEFTT